MASSTIAVDTQRPRSYHYHRFAELLKGKWGDWLSLIAGACLPLAFAPFDFFPAAVLAPALLFLLWLDIPRRRVLRR